MWHHVCTSFNVQRLENVLVLLCYVLLHARLCVSNMCVVRLRVCNTKQVVFGTVDSTNYVCVCECVFPLSAQFWVNLCLHVGLGHVSVSVRLCVCGRGFTAHLYVVFTALWVK